MPFEINVKADLSKVRRTVTGLRDTAINAAASRALNKAAEQIKTEARTLIREERKLPARVVSRALTIRRASSRNLTSAVVASGKPIELKHYGARNARGRRRKSGITRDTRGRFTGGTGSPKVTVEVIPGRRKVVSGAFRGPNDHVFKRRGRSRLPIDKLFGPSIPTAMAKSKVAKALERKGRELFPRLLRHEVGRELQKLRGGSS